MFSAPGALVAVLAYEKHLLQAVSTAAHDPSCGSFYVDTFIAVYSRCAGAYVHKSLLHLQQVNKTSCEKAQLMLGVYTTCVRLALI